MLTRPVTLAIPMGVYDQIRRASERTHRPVDDVLIEAITAVAPVVDTATDTLKTSLAQMAYLNDAALWQAARATMPAVQRDRLEALHNVARQGTLTESERTQEVSLLRLYRELLLVRAHAAVLLKQRGYDISDPQQFTPLA